MVILNFRYTWTVLELPRRHIRVYGMDIVWHIHGDGTASNWDRNGNCLRVQESCIT